ncbi:MAG TPA: hypothetical protein VN616_07455, partial [Puia sp.]|nr:hypothetical protein [Puia sp.]
YREMMGRVPFPPAVSILLPVNPVFSAHAELHHRLKVALENVRHRLLQDYTNDTAAAVLQRLTRLRLQVNYNSPKKSIALFASPHKEKLFYLDSTVEEKVIIGDSFLVRDLVADSKQFRDYLVLVLSDKECRFYLASEGKLERLKSEIPTEAYAYVNELPERVANFSDPAERKEIVMEKLLHKMDGELTHLLARYPLPVFVMGPERVIGHFKAHSRHLAQIAACVHGNYVEEDEAELHRVLQPCLATWHQHNNEALLALLETAAGDKLLTTGIREAWAAVSHDQGRLLVVEKHYSFPASRGDTPDRIFPESSPQTNPFCIHDAVDELIGQVISKGGNVEFVEDGALDKFGHVALIRYY